MVGKLSQQRELNFGEASQRSGAIVDFFQRQFGQRLDKIGPETLKNTVESKEYSKFRQR